MVMVSIICTTIISATVVLCIFKICGTWKPVSPTQQPALTEEELKQALKEADDAPNFQDVIEFINKEFTGVEDSDE
jgi:hypothetical protein